MRGWKAWEINDVFQDYDASKSGMLSLGSFVSVLQEEVMLEDLAKSLTFFDSVS